MVIIINIPSIIKSMEYLKNYLFGTNREDTEIRVKKGKTTEERSVKQARV